MRASLLPAVLLPTGLLLLAAGAPPSIIVAHPWARASAGMATTGAAYVTLTDNGAPDALTGASTPVGTASLHESVSDGGSQGGSMSGMNSSMSGMSMGATMKMRPVASIALPTNHPVTLAPGGYHVMITDLKAPLKAGTTFPLTLTFAHAPPQTVTVMVQPIGTTH